MDIWDDAIIIEGINDAVKILCEAFDNVETAHRKVLSLMGNKKDQSVSPVNSDDLLIIC
jgi:hypothetical protein